jgi:hypothetical protein
MNSTELLRDVFIWAYERSCARYSAVRKSLGEPDAFRLRYRTDIARIVHAVVTGRKNKKEATALIREAAKDTVHTNEVIRFVEVVETELMGLHEGNIARYRVRPTEYQQWKQNWK